ncbi:MAG: histidine phosphatase family protein [Kangiellaceae bacterium]
MQLAPNWIDISPENPQFDMSKITLVRHGQASFGSEHYDKLSDIGRLQAAKVGEFFKHCSMDFDQILHGEMSRQTDTAKIIAETMGHSAELVQHNGADEFDSENLVKAYLPVLANRSDEYREMIYGDNNWFTSDRNFKRVFSDLIELWQQDENCSFESWQSFRSRVMVFLNQIVEDGHSNRRVLIATSGGLISVALMSLLSLQDELFSKINLTVNNASLTELKLINNQQKEQLNGQVLSFNNISPLVFANNKKLITRK